MYVWTVATARNRTRASQSECECASITNRTRAIELTENEILYEYNYINNFPLSLENNKMLLLCVNLIFRPGHVCKKKVHMSQFNWCPFTKTNNHQTLHPFIFYKKGIKIILIYNRMWLYRYNCTCIFFVNKSKQFVVKNKFKMN